MGTGRGVGKGGGGGAEVRLECHMWDGWAGLDFLCESSTLLPYLPRTLTTSAIAKISMS